MDLGVAGRVALITGGSAGLGYATAEALAREGVRIALNGRDGARLDTAVAKLRAETGAEVGAFPGDVSVRADAEAVVRSAAGAMGAVDILLCNAAGPGPGPFLQHSPDDWQEALDLNLLSAVNLSRAALPAMRERRWGRILCMGSIAAKQPHDGLILSTAARAGLLGFAKALSDEVARDGVTVNVLCPGLIATARLRSLAEKRAASSGGSADDAMAENAALVPMHRVGRPAEFGAVAAFLASELASYVTGTALSIDGGLHRSIL
jgi:3-oxoacyl-[acyl-carrier protein] reductase